MKILAINGSGRANGNTARLLKECQQVVPGDLDIEIIHLSKFNLNGCIGCEGCAKTYKCVLQDDMQKLYPKIEEADGLILASPTYFYNITAKMKAFIERLYPYEIFDEEDRHVWMGLNEVTGIKHAMVIGVCEQLDESDMGFTIEAMSMPLQALGYRVIEEVKILNLFKPGDALKSENAMKSVKQGMTKLYKTMELKNSLSR